MMNKNRLEEERTDRTDEWGGKRRGVPMEKKFATVGVRGSILLTGRDLDLVEGP